MVDADETFVIVGGGLAGAKAAETLRAEGFAGRVILIGDERDHPYERPPLSKGYLTGKDARDSALVHPPAWYAQADIELHLGQPVTAVDRDHKAVRLADGTTLNYDKLLLATGAAPRPLDVPGSDLTGVHHLRRLSHADRLQGVLAALGRDNGHLVVAGAGWIGLEAAAAARGYGAEVTVVEPQPTPLHQAVGPELGQVFADLHAEHGVRFRFGTRLTEIVGQDGMVLAARTDDGEEHPAHAVLAAVGAVPNTALAETAGLALVDRAHGGGIAVDASLRTSDPDVFAAGDVAAAHHPLLGVRLRVEHWANALNGGPAAARAMLGQDVSYDRVPYFFTDQYDLGMEYSGWAPPGSYDQVVLRGDVAKRQFVAFWLKDRRVLAGMNVNVWDVTEPVQDLIRSRRPVDPEALADPGTPLGSLPDRPDQD
ncbi:MULTISPECIES: NAD(P)/FAD-dependent oxidoreductase [unclassified Streptomyces]|uniref:NAD(P)/FAD-dependent oxidoreductase n=1 Tax=unclassified Streptomyces TaxID=2593676 RepID=UPI0008DDF6D4|nr:MULTISPECIES: FAD-dependent oxidoreductase [unclassified Streptomyces]OII64387.1 FAD-dependent oxidoreductase [Streptomyces sp. CC77]